MAISSRINGRIRAECCFFYLGIANGLNCAPKWQINRSSDKCDIIDVNGKNNM